jgi:hypothetical protein
MANKKIDNSTLIDKDFLDNSIKKFEDLLSVTNQTIDAFKVIASEGINMAKSKPLEGYGNLKEISKGIEQFDKAVKGIAITEAKQALFSKEILSLKTKQEAQSKKSNETIKEQSTLLKKQNAEIKKQTSVIIKQTKETDKLTVALENEEKKKAESAKNSKKLTSVFDEQKKRLNDLKKEYKEQAITLGENSDEAQGLLVEITKLNDAMNAIEKSTKSVTKEVVKLTVAETEQEKLKKRLLKLSTQEAKDTEEIRQQIVATQKAIRDEVKERITLLDEYQKQSKALSDNKKEYKALFLQTEKNRKGIGKLAFAFTDAGKRLKVLKKDISDADEKLKKLDKSVGENTRSIGSYKQALKSLEKELGTVKKEVQSVNNALKATGLIAFLGALKSSFGGSEEGAVVFEKAITTITISIALLITKLSELFVQGTTIFNVFERGRIVFEGFSDEVAKAIEKNLKLVDSNEELRKAQLKQQIVLADLKKGYEALRLSAEDTTTPLLKQIEASKLAVIELLKINKIEKELALSRVTNAKKALDINSTSVSAQQAYTEAYVAYIDIQINAENELRDIQKTGTEALRDEFEQDLDFLFDVSDARKIANEKFLADETKTTSDRLNIIKSTEKDISDSFDNIIKKTVEYQNRVNKSNKAIGKSTTDTTNLGIKLREALTATTTEEVTKQVKALELDENVKKRILQLAREMTLAEADFVKAKVDTTKIIQKDIDLNSRILLQQERLVLLQNVSIDLDEEERISNEKLLDSEIALLQSRILLEEDSIRKLELQKQLNDLIIQRTKEQISKVKAIEDKAIEDKKKKDAEEIEAEKEKQARLQELRQLGIDGVRAIAEKNLEATTANIDREISALESRESTLRELASRGVENVENNLALEQKRRAELEAKRAQAVKRQQQVELGLAVLETYSNKVGNGDKNALGSTIADTSLLLSFISSLPAFYEGADRVGDNLAPTMSGKDGHVVRVDGDEMVMNGVESKMIRDSGMSRLEVATMAQMSDKGMRPIAVNDNSAVVKGLQDLKIAIDSKPVYDFKYSAVRDAVADVVESRGRLETSWRKNSEFF